MKTRAAVAFEAKKPLEIVELDLEGPKTGEVLVEIMATGICHTDAYMLDGFDSEGMFPSVLGHEGAGIVREVGAGRSEEHTSELQSLLRIWYPVFCLKNKQTHLVQCSFAPHTNL